MSIAPRLCLLALPFVACSTSIHLDSNWATWSSMTCGPSTESRVVAIDCSDQAKHVRTRLRANGSGGELTLRLVGPDGVERHRQVVARGECEVEQNWPAQAGRWILHVDANEFAGSCSVALEANDEPIRVRIEIAGDSPR